MALYFEDFYKLNDYESILSYIIHVNGYLKGVDSTVLGVWTTCLCGVTPEKSLSCRGVFSPPLRGVSTLVSAIRFWASCEGERSERWDSGYKTARLGSTWTGPNLQDLVLWRWSSGRAQGHGAIGQVVFGQKSAGGWVCDSRLFGGLTGDFAGLAQFDHLLQLGVRDLKRKIWLFKINLPQLILNY